MGADRAHETDRPENPARVLILTALPEELGAFIGRRLPPAVIAAATGDGPRKAARIAAVLCARYRPALLIGVGVAGALTPDLTVGDLVVAYRVLDAAGETTPPHAVLVVRAAAKPGARQGTLLSVDRPVVTAAGKAAWAGKLGVGSAAVDMESAAWARAAAAHDIPCLIIRAVSDTSAEELPGYLTECMDEDGGMRRSAVAMRALAHPGSIPALLRMRRRVADCSQRLAAFVEQFVWEGP
jgi:adenosylhomocysteine nucleosidase